jgi:hypothetical protein
MPAPLQPRFGSLLLLSFPKTKIAVKREQICECDGHTVHKLSRRRFTADWLAQRESDRSRMRTKVSSDCLSCYNQAMQPVLEIFKMDGYIPDSPRTEIPAYMYRGADTSLARPGRKQARKHVMDARDFNNIETRALIKYIFFAKARRRN